MVWPGDRIHRAVRQLRRRLQAEAGFSLVEVTVVMVVMLAILAPLTYSFIAADRAQLDQTRRFDAQQNARQALDRMRKDIHCAHAANDPYTNPAGGKTLILTETNNGVPECPGLVQTGASGVQWCTIPVSGFTNRYRLYRENDPNTTCDGTASTFMVDYLTRADLWGSPTCVSGQYATVDLTMPVDTEASNSGGSYTLADEIAIRNGDICP
jgi:type II secretory pathway pseudopilin PulG